jgi:peptidoglycan/xylan/chitin deacetylase (PgdA/CDA1 family)
MAQPFHSFLTEEKVKYPHVHLSFDDHSVSNWYACRDLFNKYGAKAVFYIDSFHLLEVNEIQMLKELREDGHVIGCHSKSHKDALVYVRRYDIDRYIDDEVIPAMEDMAGAGFKPTHFAFPYSHFDETLYSAVSPFFCYVRPGNESHFYSGERMFFSPNRLGKEEAPREALIRSGAMERVLEGLRETAEARRGISIVLHDIRPTGADAHTGTHAHAHITREELEQILKTLNETGYAYETFEKVCKYGADPFDKPDGLV